MVMAATVQQKKKKNRFNLMLDEVPDKKNCCIKSVRSITD
jgi:ribosomal protein L7/L12